MGIFGDDFGGFFDFDKNGAISPDEEYIGLKIISDVTVSNTEPKSAETPQKPAMDNPEEAITHTTSAKAALFWLGILVLLPIIVLLCFKTAADKAAASQKRAEQNAIAAEMLVQTAQKIGLEDVEILFVDTEYPAFRTVIVRCSNFGKLSYTEMLSIDRSLSSAAFNLDDERLDNAYYEIKSFLSQDDTYILYPNEKTIYCNGIMLCDESSYYWRTKAKTIGRSDASSS